MVHKNTMKNAEDYIRANNELYQTYLDLQDAPSYSSRPAVEDRNAMCPYRYSTVYVEIRYNPRTFNSRNEEISHSLSVDQTSVPAFDYGLGQTIHNGLEPSGSTTNCYSNGDLCGRGESFYASGMAARIGDPIVVSDGGYYKTSRVPAWIDRETISRIQKVIESSAMVTLEYSNESKSFAVGALQSCPLNGSMTGDANDIQTSQAFSPFRTAANLSCKKDETVNSHKIFLNIPTTTIVELPELTSVPGHYLSNYGNANRERIFVPVKIYLFGKSVVKCEPYRGRTIDVNSPEALSYLREALGLVPPPSTSEPSPAVTTFNSIQSAIDSAKNSSGASTIFVMPGTYTAPISSGDKSDSDSVVFHACPRCVNTDATPDDDGKCVECERPTIAVKLSEMCLCGDDEQIGWGGDCDFCGKITNVSVFDTKWYPDFTTSNLMSMCPIAYYVCFECAESGKKISDYRCDCGNDCSGEPVYEHNIHHGPVPPSGPPSVQPEPEPEIEHW